MRIESTLAPLFERWDDPGPDLCGAGSRVPSYTYLAAIEGEVIVEWRHEEPEPELSLLRDIAQEECPWVQVENWEILIDCTARRAFLTVVEFDERTAHEPDDDGPDHDAAYDKWRDGD